MQNSVMYDNSYCSDGSGIASWRKLEASLAFGFAANLADNGKSNHMEMWESQTTFSFGSSASCDIVSPFMQGLRRKKEMQNP